MATHWKKLKNQEYVGAYLLQPGEERTVTIRTVGLEDVTVEGGRKDKLIVARLEGEKPFIVNSTNAKTISRLHGSPNIEDWAGKQITLYASTTNLKGEVVECLRIKPYVKAPAKKPIDAGRLDQAIASILAGKYTEAQLTKTFELTDEQSEIVRCKLTEGVTVVD